MSAIITDRCRSNDELAQIGARTGVTLTQPMPPDEPAPVPEPHVPHPVPNPSDPPSPNAPQPQSVAPALGHVSR